MSELNDVTGLDLEGFLHLLRADLGAWATLGLIGLLLGLMAWTSWGSHRALRKCLVLSVLAHCGLALHGGSVPVVLLALRPDGLDPAEPPRIRSIKVVPIAAKPDPGPLESLPPGGGVAGAEPRGAAAGDPIAPWDRPLGELALADARLPAIRPDLDRAGLVRRSTPEPLEAAPARPEAEAPALSGPESRPVAARDTSPPPPSAAPSEDEVAAAVVEPAGPAAAPARPAARLRPGPGPRAGGPGGAAIPRPALGPAPPLSPAFRPGPDLAPPALDRAGPVAARSTGSDDPAPDQAVPAPGGDEVAAAAPMARDLAPTDSPATATDLRRRARPAAPAVATAEGARPDRAGLGPLALAHVTPRGAARLPEVAAPPGRRPLANVPEVYSSRLDPNRSALAYRAGASPASEQAVERALDWLARHQDSDGRWDAATARFDDGAAVKGDDDHTVHCPPGDTCFGECVYWEADTALTGLALLSYLAAGYTHTDGKHAGTVGKGLDFLLATQKPDGDLRGRSKAVGMYCHAMSTIALCEAYALTRDDRLRAPVERAVGFIARARATDGLAWRYAPGAPAGDTSILGWVVMALKSAREVGIEVPSTLQQGSLGWLARVASGPARGLGRYQPHEPVTPTMTAEAWVCRQFLGVGGPGPASSEAAAYLIEHGPNADPYNLYYWYYGTLAMYQHGGDAWTRWNAQVRDAIVSRQRLDHHAAGSWDPDTSPYGAKGGRIYCTALATLSLEVYYRYLRLYDAPRLPPDVAAPDRDRTLGQRDRWTRPKPAQTPR